MQSTHLRDLGDLRRRVNEIEERVPWVGVASGWAEQRGAWVEQLQSQEPTCAGLGRILLTLEGALLPESMAPQWAFAREGWRGRVAASIFPEMLHIAIDDFEHAIEWHRILLAPDGRFPTQAGLGSAELRNTGSVGLPRPIGALTGEEAARPPPEGLPRAAARMLLLLRAMGVRQYDPGVALQLLEVMHFYTAEVLTDAQAYARLRWLGACARSGQHAAQQARTACQQAPIEQADLLLAVRGRTSRGFLRPPPREVLAQQASEQNVLPMPLMPRRATVRLPPPDECAAAGRHAVSHDEQELCWWQDVTRA
jgi:hypothetical protein